MKKLIAISVIVGLCVAIGTHLFVHQEFSDEYGTLLQSSGWPVTTFTVLTDDVFDGLEQYHVSGFLLNALIFSMITFAISAPIKAQGLKGKRKKVEKRH